MGFHTIWYAVGFAAILLVVALTYFIKRRFFFTDADRQAENRLQSEIAANGQRLGWGPPREPSQHS